MTALQTLRHHQGLLVGLILFALFAFVLGEVISSRDRIFSSDRTLVASVGDDELHVEEYRSRINQFMEANKQYNVSYGVAAQQVYEQWVIEKLLEQQYEAAGISVGAKGTMNGILELPDVKQYFTNALGQVDENALQQWVSSVRQAREAGNAEAQEAWALWQDMKQRGRALQESAQYADMVQAGLTATTLDGKIEYAYQNDQVDGQVVYLPYSSIDDKTVEVTDAEITSYVNKHADEYKRSESRDIQLALIPVEPSEKDAQAVLEKITELLKDKQEYNEKTKSAETVYGFQNTENDSVFVSTYTDAGSRYSGAYVRNIENEDVKEWVEGAKIGEVFGPYRDKDSYKLSKLQEVRTMPDSARFSHVLISYEGNQIVPDAVLSKEAAKATADSIAAVIKSRRATLEDMALKYSMDPSAAENKGLQQWVKYSGENGPIEDFIFFSPKGSIGVIETPAGYHVVKVEDQKDFGKSYKMATVTHFINPSKETSAVILGAAQNLSKVNTSVEEFMAEAAKYGYAIVPAMDYGILQTSYNTIGDNASITRWAFEDGRKVNDTKIFDEDGYQVVAMVSGMRSEGVKDAEQARAEVEPILVKEKKAAMLSERLAKAKGSMEEIAKAVSGEVYEATSMTMATPIIAGVGRAPKTVGVMFGMKEGQVSAPVVDETGVLVATVVARRAAEEGSTTAAQASVNEIYKAYIQTVMTALESKADIEDNREKIEKMF
ncbi:MAG: peptidylprolyl isomerase [Flavobacteriales bacterium]|nr:peptidylprolyl isomerase [Flavobacteriales bacterium]